MEYHRASSATAFSKKVTNGHGLTAKHVYDGVFGCPTKQGSRAEDFSEIFGGSGSSSIPILDVPELNECGVSVDARSSKLDYSKIFGGFGDADFAVPYEKLFTKPKKGKISSREARNPAGAGSLSAESENSSFSERKQVPTSEASLQSFDSKQYNTSYHRTSSGSKNGTNGMTHVAQLHAIPGYARLIDEMPPSQKTGKPVHSKSMFNDADLNVNVGEQVTEGKHYRRAKSGPQPIGAVNNTFRNHAEFQKRSSRNRSLSNDMSFDAFEIGFGTHQSRMPPPLSSPPNLFNNNGGSNIAMNSNFGASRNDIAEGPAVNYSPPLFDEEVDANSAAAVSAAAVRKAIEEAQVKLKIAKELMERKREGLQSSVRLRYGNGLKTEKREAKTTEVQGMCEKEDFAGLSGHNKMTTSQVTSDSMDEKRCSIAENASGETHGMESNSPQVDHRLEEAEGVKATKTCFEPSGTGEHRATTLEADNTKKMTTSTNENEWLEKMAAEANTEKLMEGGEKIKPYDVPKQDKFEEELNSAEGAFEGDIHAKKMKLSQELQHQIEHEGEKIDAQVYEEADQMLEESYEQEKCETEWKKLQEIEENAEFDIQGSEVIKGVEEVLEAQDWVEIENKQKEAHKQEEMENRSDEAWEENEQRIKKENEIEKKQREAHKQEEMENRSDEAWEENEQRLKKENAKECEETCERVGSEKKQEEGWIQEDNDKKQSDAHTVEDTEWSGEVHKQEVTKVRLNDPQDKDESESITTDDGGADEVEKLEEAKENEKIFEEEYQMNETEKRQEKTCEGVQPERVQWEICERTDESSEEVTQRAVRYHVNNLETVGDDENENLGMIDEASRHEKNFESVEITTEAVKVEENGRIMGATKVFIAPKEIGKQSEAVEEASDPQEEKNVVTAGQGQGVNRLDGMKQTIDINEALVIGKNMVHLGETDLSLEQEQSKHLVTEYKRVCGEGRHVEEVAHELDENDMDVKDSEVSTDNEENENVFISSDRERWLGNGVESKNLKQHVEEVACELGEKEQFVNESEVASNHEDSDSSESSHEDRWANRGIDMEESQQPYIFEEREKTVGISEEVKTSQCTDNREANYHRTMAMEDREAEDILQKELELQKRHRRKMEEAKERELEKEKERIVVERAIREARERAFAEAREKAAIERASAEAHQRAKAKARERLDNSDKSTAEKASMEAKLKAERAAVERATAEARERALEKALSEKASIKAKHQAEKFASEKVSGVSGDDGIKSSTGISTDQQYRGSGPSTSSRYPNSNHGVPYSTEKPSAANCESTQRCKATLERDQRTAERAAKALAEKNMRDFLAQKEQAERNRLAETLDADVKRWSSGKEKNLRALLSTLHYIIGPDSGWQPIPLTDLISSTAVKKAYRKANLFVHPDKLQQRGASIQQKYICEKVFDLLKEAWNKFGAEER